MVSKRPTATVKVTPARRVDPDAGETATKRKVIDAAIACILELGFYRASTNEIARRAGVTWGVIQYYFGTREALMVAVLRHGARQFSETVEGVHVQGPTVVARVEELLDILSSHYAQPEYLAYLQVLLSLDHDPNTGAEVRQTMHDVAERSHDHIRRLLKETLGPAAKAPELATTIFLTLRGFGISQQLHDTMSYDSVAPKSDRVVRQRRLLAEILAPAIELAAKERS
jgi:AcrR family transcriptional regulator